MPIFGCLLVLVLSLSPVRALIECEKNKALGGFNPLPPCLFFLTNLVWVINGLFFDDVYVFFINVIMVSVNFQITIRAYRLASDEQQRQIEMVLHVYLWIAMLFGFVFLYGTNMDDIVAAYGWMCCGFNMTVFVPPLFVMKRAIENKDASTISAPFAIVGTFCTFFWSFYGILINQYSIVWPNVFGLLLCVVQTLVTVLYPGPGSTGGPAVMFSSVDAGGVDDGVGSVGDGALTPSTSSKALLSGDGSSLSPAPESPSPVSAPAGGDAVCNGTCAPAAGTLVQRAVFSVDAAANEL